jgi:hypothetical protein
MPLYREANNLSPGVFPIPYPGLSASFYSRTRQSLIPFLGAGASLPSPGSPPAQAPPAPDPGMINRVCATIGVDDAAARILVELAVSVALRMQSRATAAGTVYQRLAESASPPAAADLAEAFAEAANYNHFEWALQRILNVGSVFCAMHSPRVLRARTRSYLTQLFVYIAEVSGSIDVPAVS